MAKKLKKPEKLSNTKGKKRKNTFGNYTLKIYTEEEKKLLENAHKITNEKTATGAIMECLRILPKRMKELDTFVMQNQQLQFELDERKEAIDFFLEGIKLISKYHQIVQPGQSADKKNNGKNKFGFS